MPISERPDPDREPTLSTRPIARDLRGFLSATYATSLKSAASDEWINTYAIRPLASVLVWFFYRLRWRPVWVVLLGGLTGTLAALALLAWPRPWALPLAGSLLLLKNFLDAADGQLARATGQVDRIGRFADSLSDFWVNTAVGLATAAPLAPRQGTAPALLLGAFAALSLLLQCSLFVFYQVTFSTGGDPSAVNRTDESIRPRDGGRPRLERGLQRAYLFCYGWQDRLMAWIDRRLSGSLAGASSDDPRRAWWYGDRIGLRLTSFLGLGTTLTGYSLALVCSRADLEVLWVVLAGNVWALVCLAYRAFILGPRVRALPVTPARSTRA